MFEEGDTNKSRPLKDEETRKNLLDPVKLKQCTDVFGDRRWAIDNDDKLGSDVRVATKDVVDTDTGKTKRLTALAIRDIFDKKNECKDLLFLASGKEVRTKTNVWVVSPKRTDTVTPSHLFSKETASEKRLEAETKVSLKANPKTCGQRCVDWFTLKGMLISGTSGNKIVSASNKLEKVLRQSTLFSQDSVNIIVDNEQEDLRELDSDNDLSDDKDGEEEGDDDDEISEYILHPLLEELMDQCLDVWFSRHGYWSQDIAQGTKIEEPTIQKISSMEYVVEFYEVRCLQMKKYPTIGVPQMVLHGWLSPKMSLRIRRCNLCALK